MYLKYMYVYVCIDNNYSRSKIEDGRFFILRQLTLEMLGYFSYFIVGTSSKQTNESTRINHNTQVQNEQRR